MLRVSTHLLDEAVLLLAQTRDRNGHVTDAVDVTDAVRYGVNADLGFASQAAGFKFPLVDIDRQSGFDEIMAENDIQTQPALPGFYRYSMELGDPDNGLAASVFVADPSDATATLWVYLGSEFSFRSIYFSLAGAGSWATVSMEIEYWNGNAWTAVSNLSEGSLLDTLAGASDQVVWDAPGDWFPCTIENSLLAVEGQRRKVDVSRLWVRVRLSSFTGLVSLPSISGMWEGWPAAASNTALWQNVIRPSKAVLVLASMQQDVNQHLAAVPVVTRKQPAQFSSGLVDYGRGDYFMLVPTREDDEAGSDPALEGFRTVALDKSGASVPFPVPSTGMVLRKGRYRARVMAEIPNVGFSQVAPDTGHSVPPGLFGSPEYDGIPDDPDDPEALFDPTWMPIVAATVEHFDVRDRNALAKVSVQRDGSGNDAYTIWVERDGRLLPLSNQGDAAPYARLLVINQVGDAVLVDTMDAAASVSLGALAPVAGVSGVDSHQFVYIETAGGRKMVSGGQYLVSAEIVMGGEAFKTRSVVNFTV